AEVRAALAAPVGVDAIERLSASFDLTRQGRDGLHVGGRVQATVRQACGGTLEPGVNTIDEAGDGGYAPAGEGEEGAETDGGGGGRRRGGRGAWRPTPSR